MDLETFLVSLYVVVDDWRKRHRLHSLRRVGRPLSLPDPEVLTLAILAQWPRWRSERDFWRYADLYLRSYFPNLVSQSQLNRLRALESPSYRHSNGILPTLWQTARRSTG
jgi:hypothetical protein